MLADKDRAEYRSAEIKQDELKMFLKVDDKHQSKLNLLEQKN